MLLLRFYSYSSCGQYFGASVNACADVRVDINGAAGPNMWGEDMYNFAIVLHNGVYSVLPVGSPNDTTYGTCIIGGGIACTYQRLYNPNGMP